MSDERVAQDGEVRLRPSGPLRYVGAGFLALWLCAWAVGETVVIGVLAVGAHAWLTGRPTPLGPGPAERAPAVAVAAFLTVWLALWTLGGLSAMRALGDLVWAEDRIVPGPDGLRVTRRRGPFRSSREIPRDRLRGVTVMAASGALVAETDRANVELSRLGERREREAAAEALLLRLRLDASAAGAEAQGPPPGWEEVLSPEGERVLVASLATRRTRARVATAAAAAVGLTAAVVGANALSDPAGVAPALGLAAIAGTIAAGAAWLGRGRMEWRLGSGRIVLRRRFGDRVSDVFEARRLALEVHSDGDGDAWYSLDALAEGVAEPLGRASGRSRRRIVSVRFDPTVPRRLGRWLASRAGVSLEDRSTPEAATLDVVALRAELSRHGAVGRFAARLLEPLERRQPSDGAQRKNR